MLFGASFEDKLTALGMKCLTVAGGFVAGYMLGWVAAVAANKWALKKEKTPDGLKQLLRVVCGIAVALLVAVSLMWGSGEGAGGNKDKSGTSDAADDKKTGPPTTTETPKDEKKQPTPATVPDPRPADVTVRITVLGGSDVRDQKFYLIDDDRGAKTLAEVKTELTARKAKESRKVVVALLPSERTPLPLEHAGWTQLVRTVKDEVKLAILLPESK